MPDVIRTILVEQKMMYEEKIAQLIKERDEARREVCRFATSHFTDSEASFRRANGLSQCDPSPAMSFKDAYSIKYAEHRQWDCFKEETNDQSR